MGKAHGTAALLIPMQREGKRKMGIAQGVLNELQGSPLVEVSCEEIKQRANDAGIKVTLKNAENAFELVDQEVCRQLKLVLAQNGLQ